MDFKLFSDSRLMATSCVNAIIADFYHIQQYCIVLFNLIKGDSFKHFRRSFMKF